MKFIFFAHKTFLALSVLASLCLSASAHADAEQAAPAIPAPASPPSVFHDESEAGIVITSGNSSSDNFNFKQLNTYAWDLNTLKFDGKYLDARSNGVSTALYWNLGLRYERVLYEHLSAYASQAIESDVFSGYLQRYNTDVGAKFFIYKEDALYWDVEAGYRYSIENRLGSQATLNYLRFYTEANRDWTKTFSTKADVEYLANLTVTSDYQVNTDISVSAALNDVFAIKVGYGIKYRNVLIPPATYNTDTQFTTALVAKL